MGVYQVWAPIGKTTGKDLSRRRTLKNPFILVLAVSKSLGYFGVDRSGRPHSGSDSYAEKL